MEGVNAFKETFLLGTLNVGLPTFDVYSDIGLTYKLYTTKTTSTILVDGFWTEKPTTPHPIYASSLLIPFMINYVLGWRAWYYGDVKNQPGQRKKFTWIFALLGCYPQLVASRIIYLFWKQPKKALQKKKHLERNVMENEVFTEAVPTTLIMTFFMVVLVLDKTEETEIFLGDGVIGSILFIATFATSALSAGLGLAKCLKVSALSFNMQTILNILLLRLVQSLLAK